jgi:hypothetical protein
MTFADDGLGNNENVRCAPFAVGLPRLASQDGVASCRTRVDACLGRQGVPQADDC